MEWPRTSIGTLQCPCGNTGVIFICVGEYFDDDLEPAGNMGGYCSEECYHKGRDAGHLVPCYVNSVSEPSWVGGLFS